MKYLYFFPSTECEYFYRLWSASWTAAGVSWSEPPPLEAKRKLSAIAQKRRHTMDLHFYFVRVLFSFFDFFTFDALPDIVCIYLGLSPARGGNWLVSLSDCIKDLKTAAGKYSSQRRVSVTDQRCWCSSCITMWHFAFTGTVVKTLLSRPRSEAPPPASPSAREPLSRRLEVTHSRLSPACRAD